MESGIFNDFFTDKMIKTIDELEANTVSRDTRMTAFALDIIKGKWKSAIMYEVHKHENIRFCELKRALPNITNAMLTATLREMEEYGIINREQFNEIPPHVEYSLTDMGKDLRPIYLLILQWAIKYDI